MFDKESAQAAEYGIGGSGDTFKFPEGKSRVRVLAGGTPIAQHWIGGKPYVCYGAKAGCPHHGANTPKDKDGKELKPRVQNVFYILNKSKDPNATQIQLAYFPYTVFKAIKSFSEEQDYEFDELPMPYDIGVTYDKDESPADMYKVIAGKINSPVPKEVLDELATKPSIEEIVETQKEKASGGAVQAQHPNLDDEESEPGIGF